MPQPKGEQGAQAATERPLTLSVSGRQLAGLGLCLWGLEAVFLILHHTLPEWSSLWKRFNLNLELSIPTWFSSIQLAAIAAVAAYCAGLEEGRCRRLWRSGWTYISLFFLYVSMDETAELHELIGERVTRIVPQLHQFKERGYFWLVVFSPVIVGAMAGFAVFFWRRFRARRVMLLAGAGLLMWMVAIRLEVLAAVLPMTWDTLMSHVSLEEFLEMAGATCLLLAFLRYATTLPPRSLGGSR